MDPTSRPARSLNVLYPLVLLLAIGTAVAGGVLIHRTIGQLLLLSGLIGIFAVLATWPLAIALSSSGILGCSFRDAMTPVYERLEQFSVMMNEMSEQQLLSEQAKTVAYREKDREALRRAIKEDLAKKDWEAALVLVDEMDNRFGYKQEAERIRTEITQQFDEHIRRQVNASRQVIERYTSNQQWAAAQREADRMVAQFPTNEDSQRLSTEIETRRSAYRDGLLTTYNEQIGKKDIDGAIATVRQLDFYLTPSEASGMQDSVRNLFRDKQAQLRDAFADAVHKTDWTAAYRIGEIIVRDFPNTQMAKEVRDKMDMLRQNAGQPPVAATA